MIFNTDTEEVRKLRKSGRTKFYLPGNQCALLNEKDKQIVALVNSEKEGMSPVLIKICLNARKAVVTELQMN